MRSFYLVLVDVTAENIGQALTEPLASRYSDVPSAVKKPRGILMRKRGMSGMR